MLYPCEDLVGGLANLTQLRRLTEHFQPSCDLNFLTSLFLSRHRLHYPLTQPFRLQRIQLRLMTHQGRARLPQISPHHRYHLQVLPRLRLIRISSRTCLHATIRMYPATLHRLGLLKVDTAQI